MSQVALSDVTPNNYVYSARVYHAINMNNSLDFYTVENDLLNNTN